MKLPPLILICLAALFVATWATAQTEAPVSDAASLVQSAYNNLRTADHDYNGHRGHAMDHLKVFAKHHSIEIVDKQDGKGGEQQSISDQQLETALNELQQVAAMGSLGKAPHLLKAIEEIQEGLKFRENKTASTNTPPAASVSTEAVVSPASSRVNKEEVASEVSSLLHSAYQNLEIANWNYGGKKAKAMQIVAHVAQQLGLDLGNTHRQSHGQAASDYMLNSAKRDLTQAASILEKNGLNREANELGRAVADLTVAGSIH